MQGGVENNTPQPDALFTTLRPAGNDEPTAAAQLHVYGKTPPEALKGNPERKTLWQKGLQT
jgi:hypothetical protein